MKVFVLLVTVTDDKRDFTFWLRQELKELQSLSICLSDEKLSRSVKHHNSGSDLQAGFKQSNLGHHTVFKQSLSVP